MLNWRLRYEPFIALLNQNPAPPTVLDVGSGWFGLSWFWPHPVIQTDLQFEGTGPRNRRPGEVRFVCASAERLPFVDRAFDVVVSSDLLEHLPSELRGISVTELTRVARHRVIIGFPTGWAARTLDRSYAGLLRARRRPLPQWLSEHLDQAKYPDQADVERAMPLGWRVAGAHRNGNLLVQALVVLADELPVVRRLARLLERRLLGRGLPHFLHFPPTVRTVIILQPDVS